MTTTASSAPPTAAEADVIVVGAGPSGATTAFHLAQAGVNVLLLEKTAFPREKVCGDGLTPRAVRQLVDMGVDISPEAGWMRHRGLRVIGGGHRLELDWPDLADFPNFGLVRPRAQFDQILATRAAEVGADLRQQTNVTGPVLDDRTGRIVGVTVKPVDEHGRSSGDVATYRSRVVVAADGNSSRLSLAMGLQRRTDRPMGVAVRTYYRNTNDRDDYLESWLDLRDGNLLLPGYGWIFAMGDGTCNVGLGLLDTSASFRHVDYKAMMERWLAQLPPERGFVPENMTQPIRGAALPMGFNRQPHYTRGLLLVGDAGGMVNPFNGEGIAYAMESGSLAAEVISQALVRSTATQRERALAEYPRILKSQYGGYYTLGRWFVKALGDPRFMQIAIKHGLGRRALMQIVLKLLANLTDKPGNGASDRVLNALERLTPDA